LPVRIFKAKRAKKRIILYGHKLHGNLNSLYMLNDIYQADKHEYYYVTLDPGYYKKISNKKNVLFALNPFHTFKLVLSDCIISDHGLHTLLILLKLTNIKFIDVWHGIPFKGFTPEDFKLQHQYNEIWVSSKLLKEMYITKFGFSEDQIYVTGYGRTDLLLHYKNNKYNHKIELNIPVNKKIILFAPTWKQDDKKRSEIPFGLKPEDFLMKLQEFAKRCNAYLIIRFHLNTSLEHSLGSEHSTYLPLSSFPNSEKITGISDILITDWSSIAFDMMALEKPIVFLDSSPPFKNGFSLPPDFRAGDVVKSYEELEKSLTELCLSEDDYILRHRASYDRVRNLVYDDTVDGRSTERYMKRLDEILEKKH